MEIYLVNVAAANRDEFVRVCESEYCERLERAAVRIRASGARIIMLTGPSASGKTTSAHKLAATMVADGTPAKVISLDNFFRGAENYPLLPDGTRDYESPATLDMPEINRCLSQLNDSGETDLPIYDFKAERRAAQRQHISLEGGVCFVEGIHALNPQLTRLLPPEGVFRIYAGLREEYSSDGRRVINTQDIRLCRRILRDAAGRGHSTEKTLSMWNHVLDGENKYIKIYKETANFILDTSFTYEMNVIAGLAGTALAATPQDSPYYPLMRDTAAHFAELKPLPAECVPAASMLQEFYGKDAG